MTNGSQFKVKRVQVALEPGNGTHVLTPATELAGRLKARIEGLLLDDSTAADIGSGGSRYVSRLPTLTALPDLAAELRGLSRILEREMAGLARGFDIPWSLRVVDQAAQAMLGELGPEDLLVATPRSRVLRQLIRPGMTLAALTASIRHPLLLLTRPTRMEHPVVCGCIDVAATRRAISAAVLMGGDVRDVDLAVAGEADELAAQIATSVAVRIRPLRIGTGRAALALATTTAVHDLIVMPAALGGLGDLQIADLLERLALPLLIVP